MGYRTSVSMMLALILMIPTLTLVNGGDNGSSIAIMIGSPTRAPSFTNVSEGTGLAGYRGDNLAWGDYNNDGYLDLLVRGPSSNYLFKNNGDGTFTEVSNDTGVNITRGYSQWADFNGDGYLDFYTAANDDHLFRNNGPPNWDFTDVTTSAGNPSDGLPTEGIAWGDYNRDGYPDIFTVGWRKPGDLQWPYAGEMDRLYQNNRGTSFTDVSISAGLNPRSTSYAGMGVVWCDPNEDGWPDIYVSNYHINPNELWINDRDGTFTESAFEYNLTGKETYYQGNYYYGHSNGAGWADFDNDQDMDLWVSHLAHKDDERSGMNRGYFCADSQLFENSGPPYLNFTDIRVQVGIPITPSGTTVQDPDTGDVMWKDEDYFGVAWGDMENDGDLDLWVPQVKTYSFWDHSFLWENDGDKTFTDSTDATNLKVWSNTGGTWIDYDNDGDLDFCTEGTYPFKGPRELHLFNNPGNSNHWIEFDLQGEGGQFQTSTDAVGSKVVLKSGDLTLTRYVGGDCGGHGFQQPQRLHFGLGSRSTIDEIWVYWTSGRIQKLSGMPVDAIYTLKEPTTKEVTLTGPVEYHVLEDEEFSIDISISGAAISEKYWDTDHDRIFETLALDPPYKVNYSAQGPKWLRFRVKDTYATYWDLEPIVVEVSNVAPTVSIEKDITLFEDEEYLLVPDVQDTQSDLSTMRYKWYMDDYMISNMPELMVSFEEMNSYEITVKVLDDDGEESSDTAIIKVENQVPEPNLTHKGPISEGSNIKLSCRVNDSAQDIKEMKYRFISGDGRLTSWQSLNYTRFEYPEDGEFRTAVEVRDRHGETAVDYSSLTVLNKPPRIYFSNDHLNLDEDEEYQFEVDVRDEPADEDDLQVKWDLGDGTVSEWTTSFRIKHDYETEGEYYVTIRARDDDEEANPAYAPSRRIVVSDPDPEIRIDEYVPSEIYEESILHLSGDIEDNPSDEKEMEHRWDLGDGNVTLWSDSDVIFSHTYMVEGVYSVKLEVIDAEGDIFNITHNVTVLNIIPETSIVSSKISPDMDEEVTFTAKDTKDTSLDLLNMEYTWYIEGNAFHESSQIKYTFTSSGTKTVSLILFDGTEYSNIEKLKIAVNNPPPTISLYAPSRVKAGESFILDASGTYDTLSDQPRLKYIFEMDDGKEPIESHTPIVNYTYEKGGTYSIILTVLDTGVGSTFEHEIEVAELLSPASSSGSSGALIFLALVGLLSLLIIVALAVALLLKRRREAEQQLLPPPYLGRTPPMSGSLPVSPPQRAPLPVQPRSQQKELPPGGRSVLPPPKQPN